MSIIDFGIMDSKKQYKLEMPRVGSLWEFHDLLNRDLCTHFIVIKTREATEREKREHCVELDEPYMFCSVLMINEKMGQPTIGNGFHLLREFYDWYTVIVP